MSKRTSSPKFTLPRTWPCRVRSALLHVVALAQYATAHTRSWAAESCNTRVRLRATVDQIQQEIALLQAEICCPHDHREVRLIPRNRPHAAHAIPLVVDNVQPTSVVD
jgi:hypothetical protein